MPGDRAGFRPTDRVIELLVPDPGAPLRWWSSTRHNALPASASSSSATSMTTRPQGSRWCWSEATAPGKYSAASRCCVSRVFRRVTSSALAPAEVCELISAFHPIYRGVDAELLLLVDDRFAHGNLRDWASFTYTAAKLCADEGRRRLDEETARNAFTLHGCLGA